MQDNRNLFATRSDGESCDADTQCGTAYCSPFTGTCGCLTTNKKLWDRHAVHDRLTATQLGQSVERRCPNSEPCTYGAMCTPRGTVNATTATPTCTGTLPTTSPCTGNTMCATRNCDAVAQTCRALREAERCKEDANCASQHCDRATGTCAKLALTLRSASQLRTVRDVAAAPAVGEQQEMYLNA